MQPQLLAQGQHPTLGNFFHVLLPSAESGVVNLLHVMGDKATVHKVLQTGEIVSTALDIPALRTILAAIDSFIG